MSTRLLTPNDFSGGINVSLRSVSHGPAADVLRMIEAQPELASQLRRVRGGYLKIQGTWLPFEVGVPSCVRPVKHAFLTAQPFPTFSDKVALRLARR